MEYEEDFYGGGVAPDVSQHLVHPYDASLVQSPYSSTFAWRFRLQLIECEEFGVYSGSILPETYYTCLVTSSSPLPPPRLSLSCVLVCGDGVYDWTPCLKASEPFLACSGSAFYKFMDLRLPFRIVQKGNQYEITQNNCTLRTESKGMRVYFQDLSYNVIWSAL